MIFRYGQNEVFGNIDNEIDRLTEKLVDRYVLNKLY